MRQRIHILDWVGNPLFERIAIGVIVANALILALETVMQGSALMTLKVLDKVCLVFFIGEIGLRFTYCVRDSAWKWQAGARRYLHDGWNLFDVFVIVAAFLPGLGALRTLRLLRLVAKLPAFRETVEDLLHACQKSWQVFSLAMFLTFIGALTGTLAFQEVMPNEFGNLKRAFITCYSMMFGDNVSGILSTMSSFSLPLTLLFAFFVMLMHGLVLALVVSLVIDLVQQRRTAK
jgi:voltage-gated sodium channel